MGFEEEFLDELHVVLNHNLDEFRERGLLWVPSKFGLCLCGVAQQLIYLCRTEIFRINFNESLTRRFVVTLFIDTVTAPFEFDTNLFEGEGGKLTNCMILASSNHKVIWLWLLQDEPHTLDIVLGITPVA